MAVKRKKKKQPDTPTAPSKKIILKLSKYYRRIKLPANILAFSFCAIALLFVIQSLVFVSSYQTNDDIGMTFVVSGTGTSPAPNEHMRYSHIFLGHTLKTLYSHYPGFPWYGSLHFLMHFLSMLILLYALLKDEYTWKRFFYFLVYFAVVELFFINNLQFTVTACILGQSGIFALLTGLRNPLKKSWLLFVSSALLLIASYIVRQNGFFLIILMALPVLGIHLAKNIRNRSFVAKYVVFFVIIAASVMSLGMYNKAYYNRDPGWKDFFTVNALKSRFIDFKHAFYNDETKPVFDEVKWSQNDFYMLLSWFYADETLYSKENLESVLDHFPSFKTYLSWGDVLRRVAVILVDVSFFLAIALYFTIYSWTNRENKISIFATLCIILGAMLYLIYTKRLPGRVYLPMFSFLAVTCLYFVGNGERALSSTVSKVKKIMLFIIVIGLVVILRNQFKESREKKRDNVRFKETIAKINPHNEQLFVVWGATFPYTKILPFDNLDYIRNFKLISLGTTLRTPITKKRMKEFGITDIYRALYENENIFLIVNNMRYLYYYTQYVKEHYETGIQFRYIHRENSFYVIRVFDESNPEYLEDAKVRTVRDPYQR